MTAFTPETSSPTQQMFIGPYRVQIGAPPGNMVSIAPTTRQLTLVPRPGPIYQRPQPFHGLLNRQNEVNTILSVLQTGQPIEIYGPDGVGKTSLLRHLAYHPMVSDFADGVIYLNVAQKPLDDILQGLFDAFYKRPEQAKASKSQVRRALATKKALILLDDMGISGPEINVLLQVLRSATVLMTGTDSSLPGLGHSLALLGLPPIEAEALLARELQALGRPLVDSEKPIALALITALDGYPQAIQQAAVLARTEGFSLARVTQLAQQSDSLEAMSRYFLQALTEPEKRVLSVLASLSGAPISPSHLSVLADLTDPSGALESLRRRHLVITLNEQYALSDILTRAVQQSTDVSPWMRRTVTHLVNWAEQNKADPDRLLTNAEALLQCLWWSVRHENWPDVVRLGLALEPALALRGHWDTWNQVLEWQLQAAKALKNRPAEAWVLHQMGIRSLCLENEAAAREHLIQALRIRESLTNPADIAATKTTLNFLLQAERIREARSTTRVMSVPPPEPGRALQTAPPRPESQAPRPAYESTAMPPTQMAPAAQQKTSDVTQIGLVSVIFFALFGLILIVVVGAVVFFSLPDDEPGDTIAFNFNPARDLLIEPSGVDFQPQPIGAGSVTQNVRLSNRGNVTATFAVRLANVSTADTGFNVVSNDCQQRLIVPGGSCSVSLSFAPTTPGQQTAELRVSGAAVVNGLIPDNVADNDYISVPLIGVGTAPQLVVEPQSLNFGEQRLGTTSDPSSVQVRNIGTGDLFISGVALAGANPENFIRTNDACSGSNLPPQQSCTISLNFVPSGEGDRRANLNIQTNASDAPETVALSGVGLPGNPEVNLQPAALTFADQAVNTASEAQEIRVVNNGQGNLNITGVSLVGDNQNDFLTTFNTCLNAPLGPNGECRLEVVFAPRTAGNRSAQLEILHNAASSPQRIPLNGTAIGTPEVILSTNNLTFPEQLLGETSQELVVTLTNNGNGNLTVNSITLEGDHPNDFAISANTCANAVVLSAQTCSINLIFRPIDPGTRRARLNIANNAQDSPHLVSLTGLGRGAPLISLSSSTINFGIQRQGTTSAEQTITLTNAGSDNLVINGVSLGGAQFADFRISNDTCSGTTLIPDGRCLLGVVFTPSDTGQRVADLIISANAENSPQTVTLDGAGIASATVTPTVTPTSQPTPTFTPNPSQPAIEVLTSTINFGAEDVGAIVNSSVTLTNTGQANLLVTRIDFAGTHSNDFQLTGNNCPASGTGVASKATCVIQLRFSPSATGTRQATVTLTYNASASPLQLFLLGEGLAD